MPEPLPLDERIALPFVPRTDFGRELLALRHTAVEELRAHNEPLLDVEGIRQEVHARRGGAESG